jgi:hypothetical protein
VAVTEHRAAKGKKGPPPSGGSGSGGSNEASANNVAITSRDKAPSKKD